jgi:hypothetical protein
MNKIAATSERASSAQGGAQTTKRPYASPELKAYGDLREITMTVAVLGHPDHQIQILNPLVGTAILL